MHTSNKIQKKSSKTEAIYFPSARTCSDWLKAHEKSLLPSTNTTTTPTQVTKKHQLSPSQKDAILNRAYADSEHTSDLDLPNNTHIPFTKSFKYLGSQINFLLQDSEDINLRISKANKAMGALNHFWRNKAVDTHSKFLIYMAIPTNLLL